MVALPAHWETFRPHYLQSKLWRSRARFKAVYAGRGSGKTSIAKRYIVRWLPVKRPWNDVKFFYALPTYKQAKRVAWHDLVSLIPREWISGKPNVSEMVLNTVFGTQVYVIGLDHPQRIEGVQWDGGIIDECCDQKLDEFLYTGLMPTLAHKFAWLWLIGVPKRSGVGSDFFRKYCERGERGEVIEGTDDRIETYTWKSDTVLTEEQLSTFKQQYTERDYAEQFDASWQNVGGAIFYAFEETMHVRSSVTYDPSLPICVSSDFNVNPMSWCLSHIYDGKVYVFDEIFLRNTNTPNTLNELWRMYGGHKSGFEFYGDASSGHRVSSAEFTDYAYIKNDVRFDQYTKKRLYYLRSNPNIADRFASCNSIFKNAAGEVRCFISPRCKYLIKDLSSRAYKEGTRVANDSRDKDGGHMSDAFGYLIFRRFPIRIKLGRDSAKVSVGTNRIMQFAR